MVNIHLLYLNYIFVLAAFYSVLSKPLVSDGRCCFFLKCCVVPNYIMHRIIATRVKGMRRNREKDLLTRVHNR